MNRNHVDNSPRDSHSDNDRDYDRDLDEKYEPATDDDDTLRNHEAADESKQLQADVDLEHTMDTELAGNRDRKLFLLY